MKDVFNPAKHKVVAINEDGQHLHVTLAELRADMAQLPSVVETVSETVSTDRLAVAVALATYAIVCGAQAGDFRWHGGNSDFEVNGVRMDAPALIEYAKAQI
jgi:hypothetical protein